MRVLVLCNNWLGWQIVRWLRAQAEDELVGVVLHPLRVRTYGEEILAAARLASSDIIEDGSTLNSPDAIERLRRFHADVAVSVLFNYVLTPSVFQLFPSGAVNLHPSYLPYNRGQYPNVWSLVEGTPSGVTLHYIDEGIDTGDIIAQQHVPIEPMDTGESLYGKLAQAALTLFVKTWPRLRAGTAGRQPQREPGTSHRARDVDQIDAIDLNRWYRASDLINLLRARTFPPHSGAYVTVQGRRIALSLSLTEAVVPST